MDNSIPNSALSDSDLPPPNANWEVISPFCITFNGYEYWGTLDRCAEVANRCEREWKEKKQLPTTLTELRTALFFFQRSWRFTAQGWYNPDEEMMSYVHALIEGMRVKVLAKELD